MKRVPTLMYEAEFQDFLDKQKRAVEEMKRDGLDYMSRLCRLWGRVTATAGEENEKCFTAGQLDQIFDLAKLKCALKRGGNLGRTSNNSILL